MGLLNFAKLLSATEKEFNINYSSNEIEKLTSLENFKKIISSKKKKINNETKKNINNWRF